MERNCEETDLLEHKEHFNVQKVVELIKETKRPIEACRFLYLILRDELWKTNQSPYIRTGVGVGENFRMVTVSIPKIFDYIKFGKRVYEILKDRIELQPVGQVKQETAKKWLEKSVDCNKLLKIKSAEEKGEQLTEQEQNYVARLVKYDYNSKHNQVKELNDLLWPNNNGSDWYENLKSVMQSESGFQDINGFYAPWKNLGQWHSYITANSLFTSGKLEDMIEYRDQAARAKAIVSDMIAYNTTKLITFDGHGRFVWQIVDQIKKAEENFDLDLNLFDIDEDTLAWHALFFPDNIASYQENIFNSLLLTNNQMDRWFDNDRKEDAIVYFNFCGLGKMEGSVVLPPKFLNRIKYMKEPLQAYKEILQIGADFSRSRVKPQDHITPKNINGYFNNVVMLNEPLTKFKKEYRLQEIHINDIINVTHFIFSHPDAQKMEIPSNVNELDWGIFKSHLEFKDLSGNETTKVNEIKEKVLNETISDSNAENLLRVLNNYVQLKDKGMAMTPMYISYSMGWRRSGRRRSGKVDSDTKKLDELLRQNKTKGLTISKVTDRVSFVTYRIAADDSEIEMENIGTKQQSVKGIKSENTIKLYAERCEDEIKQKKKREEKQKEKQKIREAEMERLKKQKEQLGKEIEDLIDLLPVKWPQDNEEYVKKIYVYLEDNDSIRSLTKDINKLIKYKAELQKLHWTLLKQKLWKGINGGNDNLMLQTLGEMLESKPTKDDIETTQLGKIMVKMTKSSTFSEVVRKKAGEVLKHFIKSVAEDVKEESNERDKEGVSSKRGMGKKTVVSGKQGVGIKRRKKDE